MLIKIKKIERGSNVSCYKCKKNRASFYLCRATKYGETDIPLCPVCLSAYLNYLDNEIIKAAYNQAHPELEDVK